MATDNPNETIDSFKPGDLVEITRNNARGTTTTFKAVIVKNKSNGQLYSQLRWLFLNEPYQPLFFSPKNQKWYYLCFEVKEIKKLPPQSP